jgi:hypothetical protein
MEVTSATGTPYTAKAGTMNLMATSVVDVPRVTASQSAKAPPPPLPPKEEWKAPPSMPLKVSPRGGVHPAPPWRDGWTTPQNKLVPPANVLGVPKDRTVSLDSKDPNDYQFVSMPPGLQVVEPEKDVYDTDVSSASDDDYAKTTVLLPNRFDEYVDSSSLVVFAR